MQPTISFLLLFLFSSVAFFHGHAQPFIYPTANLSTVWTNNYLLSPYYESGRRAILLHGTNGTSFACGFFCEGACESFLFAIYIIITFSSGSDTSLQAPPQVVWSANRNHPVKENATLQFSEDGNLLLRDADGTAVWSTNTSGRFAVGMNVTDTGSLVLFTKNNTIIWDSVHYPTDSWVLGQTLMEGLQLTANVSAANSTKGQFFLRIVSGGIKAYIDSKPPQLYYQTVTSGAEAPNQSTYITFINGSLSLFIQNATSSTLEFSISLIPASSFQYMRLEFDGHLRLYDWESGSDVWTAVDVMQIYPDNCAYPTVCGEYGICSNSDQCSCPIGSDGASYFKQVNERQPNLGCSPVTPISCHSNGTQLIALNNVTSFYYFADEPLTRTSEEACKQACLSNCSCKAAFVDYGINTYDVYCYLLSQVFSMMSMDPVARQINASAYIKVQNLPAIPTSLPSSPPGSNKEVNVALIVGTTVGSLLAAAFVIAFITVLLRKKKFKEFEEEDQFDMVQGIPTRFSFEELKLATENFHRKLGEGGFGSVFEGTLVDGTRVAVKRLDGVGQGKKEFLAEVETIGSVHHINLVRLVGFCAEKSHRLLVYEYMSNGSLDKWIFYKRQDTVLDWQMRQRIITDIAKGLSYLHEECGQRIAHLDIKPQNILLDDEFNAKVSDFGLSKLIDRDQSRVMTRMRGTPGYLAPEWLTSMITEKADVYSFGVVVMEIVCGRKNLDYSQPEERIHLISLLQGKAEENRLLDMVEDHSTDMEMHGNKVIDTIKLAMWCLQTDTGKRPSMSAVVKVMEGSLSVESNIDYRFSTPDPFIHRTSNGFSESALPSVSILSGPR